ncbi:MAG TPA: 6,7-dimethyl-8-ribityllumazine synthase [Gemmatimonadales bacterium]|nr:6,7-dimethyl-8-ribityllumazine synthase [Gemmatimonadales bacterium]
MAIVVSRYNELITRRLLEGARDALREAGIPDSQVEEFWVPGAFELAVAAEEAAVSGRFRAIVALGCVIRGETPHFEYVAGEAARGLGNVALAHRVAVGFGVLTTENQSQAEARAGGAAGNKGYEAAAAALQTADVLHRVRRGTARD